MNIKSKKIAILGLGYVGLPLAVEFSNKTRTVGFDISHERVAELSMGIDSTLEINSILLTNAIEEGRLQLTTKLEDISKCNIYIVTVPTPIDKNNRPVLKPLLLASESAGTVLKRGDIVIYESTVYPGVTEDECVPVIEKISGLIFNKDFFVGYSPERINPGDKEHTLTKIIKITSGSTPEAAITIDNLYREIITAGTYKASSINVAEAAKVIENSQRDINIAFVNELSKIFNLLNIDTQEILEAASTKWNFLIFKPGLVGGHCIGVDPYYLAQKAQEVGYNSEIVLAGRRVNDGMGKYVATETIKLMIKKEIKIVNSEILILGFTFKENCPDIRNTRVIDIINELKSYGAILTILDPWAKIDVVKKEYKIELVNNLEIIYKFDAIILAVGHDDFIKFEFNSHLKKTSVVYDVKGIFKKTEIDGRL